MKKEKKKYINVYKPIYGIVAVDYQREMRDTGEEIEKMVFYKKDEHIIENPPTYDKEVNKIIKILRKTGIKKLTITFLENI